LIICIFKAFYKLNIFNYDLYAGLDAPTPSTLAGVPAEGDGLAHIKPTEMMQRIYEEKKRNEQVKREKEEAEKERAREGARGEPSSSSSSSSSSALVGANKRPAEGVVEGAPDSKKVLKSTVHTTSG
jgi:hypothetical protein